MEENTRNQQAAEGQQGTPSGGGKFSVLPVIEEHMVVTREVVETGKVIIQKRVTEEEASINIPLIQEGYQIERMPGQKELFAKYPSVRYEGEDMIIPVVREVVVVEKRYEVTEELRVVKTKTEVPYLQQITLLKENVEVKRTSNDK
jgi:uncharacterized protein (TIGR02271 family)